MSVATKTTNTLAQEMWEIFKYLLQPQELKRNHDGEPDEDYDHDVKYRKYYGWWAVESYSTFA